MAAVSIANYLLKTKKHQEDKFANVKTVHVVIGNESCDLDSAVCSVALAYIYTLKNDDPDVVFIPVLNIPREKYHLRTETTFLFRGHGLTDDLLTFCDEIDLHDLHEEGRLKLSLVDHNVLPEKYNDLEDCVVTVTDHRPQVRKPNERVKITISPVGSCSTLVAREFFRVIRDDGDTDYDKVLLIILYGTILIDTINLNPAAQKMTADDKEMAGKLQQLLPDVNRDDLFNNIQKAKTDISELSTMDLFEKDLKVVSGSKVKVAMSSVAVDLQSFLSRPNLSSDIQRFMQSQGAVGVVVMTIYEKSPGEMARDIMVYSPQAVLLNKVHNALIRHTEPSLELSSMATELNHSVCFHQGCIKASRKQVLPIIQTVITEFESLNVSDDQSNMSGLDAGDLLNLSLDQTSSSQPQPVSTKMDDFDLLNLSNQGSQDQVSTGSNQNLMDEFDIFSNNNTNMSQDQTGSSLNFDLLSSSDSSQPKQPPNVDLLGGLDPFGPGQNKDDNKVVSPIPEININQAVDMDDLDEADVMFQSSNLDAPHSGVNSTSQGSSAHTSEPGSAFASYPVTPPNSFIDSSGTVHLKDFTLPSLNSAEMLEKIREKKGRLRSSESTSADVTDAEGNSVPYTPQNSYMEGAFEQYAAEHHLPSFNSMEMVQRIKDKRVSMETSRFDEDDTFSRLRTDSGEVTPFTPHNSYRDVSVLERNHRSVLDHNKLHQTLSTIESSVAEQEVDDNSLEVKERTDSGLLIFDTSNVPNPTDVHNNVVAVGLAQEMVKSSDGDMDLFDLSNETSGGGDDGATNGSNSSQNEEGPSQGSIGDSGSSANNSNVGPQGGNQQQNEATDDLALNLSIEEFAQSFTNHLIEDVVCMFPEHQAAVDVGGLSEDNAARKESDFKGDKSPIEGRQLDWLESPSIGATASSSPEDLPVETDYLSGVDLMRGNLDLVKGSESKEIVESISFRKISGEEPQTVRQEILKLATQREESNDQNQNSDQRTVQEYAASLVNHVISSAMATVTKIDTVNIDTTSVASSDLSGESMVTSSSFDTVSSLPGKDGQHGLLSYQASLDTPLSSIDIDRYSGGYSFDSDDGLVSQGDQAMLSADSKVNPLSSVSAPMTLNSDTLTFNPFGANSLTEPKTQKSSVELDNVENNKNFSLDKNTSESDAVCFSGTPSGASSNLETSRTIDHVTTCQDHVTTGQGADGPSDQIENILESVPYNFRKLDSMDYISSEGETDNLEKLQVESASLMLEPHSRSTYQKADTVDFTEGDTQDTDIMLSLQDMSSSQSSDVTSTTTEGSYQVLSPDRQLLDFKGEITPVLPSQGAEIRTGECMMGNNTEDNNLNKKDSDSSPTDLNQVQEDMSPSECNATMVIPDGNDSNIAVVSNGNHASDEKPSVVSSVILSSDQTLNTVSCETKGQDDGVVAGGSKNNLAEESVNKGDNSVFTEYNERNNSDNHDQVKEVYMTSAGRISIAREGDSDKPKPRMSITDNFIEESHKEDDLKDKELTEEKDQAQATSADNPELAAETVSGQQEVVTNDQQVKSEEQKQQPNEETTVPVTKKKKKKKKKKGMDEEWHEDPIPGMDEDNGEDDLDSIESDSQESDDSSDSTRPANRPTSLQTRKKKRISAHFNILTEDYASPDEIDRTDNAGDLEWENDTPVSIPTEPIPEYSAEDEYQDAKHWRGIEINGKQMKIDLKVIEPYKKVLSHGGYYGDGLNAIIVFSGCCLPDRGRKDYNYVMDNLFMYVISTLELLVAEDYMIVYFHGATPRRQMPSFGWLKKCYQMIDRRLKKNLKGLLLIHPTLWLRTIVLMTKPFISSKFSSKLKFVRSLHELSSIVPMEYIYVPEQVQKYDNLLQHRTSASSTSSASAPHTPP